MVEYVLTINAKDGKSYKKEVSGPEADTLLNKKINETVKGDPLGLKGYELKITGGSDRQGFPMRKDVVAGTRKRPLVVEGVGAKLKSKGTKQRKTVRGNLIDDNLKQINLKVEKEGSNKLEEVFGDSGEEKTAEEAKVKPPAKEKKEEFAEKPEKTNENAKEDKKDEGKESEGTEK